MVDRLDSDDLDSVDDDQIEPEIIYYRHVESPDMSRVYTPPKKKQSEVIEVLGVLFGLVLVGCAFWLFVKLQNHLMGLDENPIHGDGYEYQDEPQTCGLRGMDDC